MAKAPPRPRFFDRELSWLEFNQRVLDEAFDVEVPLLERLKFLAISASNLDEFFRVRMGALTVLVEAGAGCTAPSGLTPSAQLNAARQRISRMITDQYRCFNESLTPQLEANGMTRLLPGQLNSIQRSMVRQVFEQEIYSTLTPMAVSDDLHFPLLSKQLLATCVRLGPEDWGDPDSGEMPPIRFLVIPGGLGLSRFISVPSEKGLMYMLLEDIIEMFISEFCPGEEVEECVPFRVTRNAEIEVQELTPHGLADNMAEVLLARTTADCIRLELPDDCSDEVERLLRKHLQVDDEQVYKVSGPLDLSGFMELATRRGFEQLKYEPWPPVQPPDVPAEELMFDIVSSRDVLLIHPYDSFDPVVRLVEEAADDPDVMAIKQTLYRISRDSAIVKALKRAVDNGKHVTVLLELKARFDEERNLKQARELEAIGAQVIHGVKGLKTHAKLTIVVRREPHGIQRYLHFGTGNYNESTARLYSDISLLTCDEDLGMDALAFFNAVSGYSQPPYSYRKLEAAPLRLRDTLREMIEGEANRARDGEEARILVKLNAVTDPALIEALYDASQAGVQIDMNIRGICCLKPGVKGLSENIRVVSIVDRFLEHARIVYFHHGGDPKLFISSADWMQRNLDHRKELLVPVEDGASQEKLLECLETYFQDNTKSSELQRDGSYFRLTGKGAEPFRSQEDLYRRSREAVRRSERHRRTQFEPHRPER
ncbi:MAG: polyphosphate kinase 1 [Planctomycetaceae bacterium]|nr:polyphosphate kinase 1 [Planctomycetaceae bacterium]